VPIGGCGGVEGDQRVALIVGVGAEERRPPCGGLRFFIGKVVRLWTRAVGSVPGDDSTASHRTI
jgi:hypothetical protein